MGRIALCSEAPFAPWAAIFDVVHFLLELSDAIEDTVDNKR
jgi:hypothetical protein